MFIGIALFGKGESVDNDGVASLKKSGNCADDDLVADCPAGRESDTGLASDLRAGNVALRQGVVNEFAIDGHASAAAVAMA